MFILDNLFSCFNSGYCVLDIALIVDSSSSSDAGKYQSLLSFLTNVVKSSTFNIGVNFDRVALLTFSSSVTTWFDLQQRFSADDIVAGLSLIPQPYGPTNTPAAIVQAFQVR
jgi:von Willebrand factor type A domain